MVRLIVDAARGSYPVIIGSEIHRELRNLVRRLDPSSAVIVTDSNVRPWAHKVAKAIKPSGVKPSIYVVPAGERSKSMTALHDVLAFFERQKVDRGGLVIAVGGGTVGDLAGFAASVWLRGVRLLAVPTTLLAMVDSSVGGKTGVAEVVKYGVAMDRGIFELLQKDRERLLAGDRRALERVVFRCVTAKALVVARDERERGPRAILNYGHTAGHALEAASRFRVSHGRAVAFGMRMAARIALSLELCGPRLVEAQDALLTEFGLPDRSPAVDPARVLAAIEHDKKARRGRVAWVMPRRLGHAEPGHVVPAGVVRRFVRKALA